MMKGKKTKGLQDMDFNVVYNDTFDYVPDYIFPYPNVDSERFQVFLKRMAK